MKEIGIKIILTLFVFFPFNIVYNSILGSEILFTTILLYLTYLFFSDIKYKYAYIGILVGINTMIKPFFIAFSFLIFLVEYLYDNKFFISIKHALLVLLISCVTISPWIYRNTKLTGEFTYISNNGGIVLYINNNSQNKAGKWMDANNVENSVVKTEKYNSANMTEKNKMLSNAAKLWIKDHPLDFMILGFKRVFNTYVVGDDIIYSFSGSQLGLLEEAKLLIQSNIAKVLIFIPGLIYLITFSLSIVKNLFLKNKMKLDKFSIYTVILFYMFTSIYFITEGQGRYSYPLIFIMIYGFYKLFFANHKFDS